MTAAEEGKSCVLLHPGHILGGMTTGGLSYTDLGNAHAIGGSARRFYERLGSHYGKEIAWTFEPHVAAEELSRMLAASKVEVRRGCFLASVTRDGDGSHATGTGRRNASGGTPGRITEIACTNGLRVAAQVYIDAGYEGDLAASAEVPYTVGRESRDTYDEQYAGVQIHKSHQFDVDVSPFVEAGNPQSGYLPNVRHTGLARPEDAPIGAADASVQAYNFRVCMTKAPELRIPFPKPAGYERSHYVLAERWLRSTSEDIFRKFDMVTETKTDTNNHGAVSTDFIGGNHAFPEADFATRELIFQEHVLYQMGLHWFMANDPAVPEEIRTRYAAWGLSNDEFTATGNWPHQLYIREARRILGDAVVTEHECMGRRRCDDPIGMAAYQMDSHNCNRRSFGGLVRNEGDVQVKLPAPYGISYKAIVPPVGSCTNLYVPVCLSASHIAFGSVRMEPVFMILAESSAVAACMAVDTGRTVQEIGYGALEKRLLERGQVLRTDIENSDRINP